MFQQILPKLRRLSTLVVPSNGFKNDKVGLSLHQYLTDHASEVGLAELNIGNNFFDPLCLYKLTEAAICKVTTLKRLVIAFSCLGQIGENFIGDKVCQLMKHNMSITNLDFQCCNLTLNEMTTL